MTTRGIPLGRKEGQRLEFKGRDTLEDRYKKIGREVVGMLNAKQGGEIWVGLAEEEHRAVRVEAIKDAEVEARSLHDFLIDSIEPPPISEEIEIEVKKSAEGEVLRIQVAGQRDRWPYALLRKGTRYFGVRVGDRLRPLTREEIVGSGNSEEGKDRLQKGIDRVIKEQESVRQRSERLLWLRFLPVPEGRLSDLQAPNLLELLTDPTRTGNRRSGATFASVYHFGQLEPRLKRLPGTTCLEIGAGNHYSARIFRTGGVEFEAPLDGFDFFGPLPPILSSRKEVVLSAIRLAEFLVSIVRFLGGLFNAEGLWEEPPGDHVVGQLALFGLKGVDLAPDSIRSALRILGQPYSEEDFTLDQVLIVLRTELLENPDRIAFRMLRELFEAFGLPESEMPAEFDRRTGRLVLPE